MLALFNVGLLAMPLVNALTLPQHHQTKRDSQCGAHGYDSTTKAYFYEASAALATQPACGSKCFADEKCLSYAVGEGACILYTAAVYVLGYSVRVRDPRTDSSIELATSTPLLRVPTHSTTEPAKSALSVTSLAMICRPLRLQETPLHPVSSLSVDVPLSVKLRPAAGVLRSAAAYAICIMLWRRGT
jgi:hypothetical protein